MKTKPLMNFADSVRAHLLAIAKKENIQLEYLLLRYALERFPPSNKMWIAQKRRWMDSVS